MLQVVETSAARSRAARGAIAMIVVAAALAALVATPPAARSDECFSWDFPDPAIVRLDNQYVAYSTRSVFGQLPVMSSTDGCSWNNIADALPTLGRWAVEGDHVWAPAVVRVPGGFHLYYAARDRPSKRMCIGLATSPTWQGPFGDAATAPVVCPAQIGGAIDPSVFTDTDGHRYLLWKNDGNCCNVASLLWSTPIGANGRPIGASSALLSASRSWQATSGGLVIEQPEMIAANGHHLLMYSGGAWDSSGYGIGYAECAGPLGPCEDRAPVPLKQRAGRGVGTGGLSVVSELDGSFHVAYHAWVGAVGYPHGARGLFFDRLVVDAWGTPRIGADPFGSLDRARLLPGTTPMLEVSGWAIDPDVRTPVDVQVRVDGIPLTGTSAALARPDVGAAYPGLGVLHGFTAVVPVGAGAHEVCAVAMNVALGDEDTSTIGCTTVDIDRDPFGAFDAAVVPLTTNPVVTVTGWAIDPDTTAPIEAHVYVDGRGTPVVAAGARPDVAAANPGYGALHGYTATVPISAGAHQVCVFGINVAMGLTNSVLGCQEVVVGRSPFGSLDQVARSGSVARVRGWAIDPDATAEVDVRVTVDGSTAELWAAGDRPDVGAAFPAYGSRHGFDGRVIVPVGSHRVCVDARNLGPGTTDSRLGCVDV